MQIEYYTGMWPYLYALYRGHETKKKRIYFMLHVRQPHIKSQWEDVLFVDQRKSEVCRKNSKHARKIPVGSNLLLY